MLRPFAGVLFFGDARCGRRCRVAGSSAYFFTTFFQLGRRVVLSQRRLAASTLLVFVDDRMRMSRVSGLVNLVAFSAS